VRDKEREQQKEQTEEKQETLFLLEIGGMNWL